ncbi:MAG TPA: hypothetical protein VEJ23_02665 [Solirubrobacteraceae bacterium]|nr:hypothetical protein [Solirubrobacteraceae bacterium]
MPTARARARSARALEAWLWTGPLGHLVGGGLDILAALTLHLRARARTHSTRRQAAHLAAGGGDAHRARLRAGHGGRVDRGA